MTDRERRWVEFERAQTSMRRAMVLTILVLVGALLGYRPAPVQNASVTISAGYPAP